MSFRRPYILERNLYVEPAIRSLFWFERKKRDTPLPGCVSLCCAMYKYAIASSICRVVTTFWENLLDRDLRGLREPCLFQELHGQESLPRWSLWMQKSAWQFCPTSYFLNGFWPILLDSAIYLICRCRLARSTKMLRESASFCVVRKRAILHLKRYCWTAVNHIPAELH